MFELNCRRGMLAGVFNTWEHILAPHFTLLLPFQGWRPCQGSGSFHSGLHHQGGGSATTEEEAIDAQELLGRIHDAVQGGLEVHLVAVQAARGHEAVEMSY
jgi:hypothetical protein